ncbi:MAG: SDR family NAD(P)-dependent oxidoreductase [Halanaeroarchaeum sp.]
MRTRPEHRAGVADVDRSDVVALVTGATSGVGRETALALGRLGASVIAHGRSPEKMADLERALEATDAAGVRTVKADFLDLDAVRDLAESVRGTEERLDVLVNNAGTYFPAGGLTPDGVERTIVVNHLAPFVLTHRLRGLLEAARGRVVTTSSDVHRRDSFDLAALTSIDDYDGLEAYGCSKFANVLFTKALARRLDDATANCFHPGFIPGSGLYRDASLRVRLLMGLLEAVPKRLTGGFVSTAADGAATAVYLAVSDDVADETGAYFDDLERVDPAPATRDESRQEDLWEWSEETTDETWE